MTHIELEGFIPMKAPMYHDGQSMRFDFAAVGIWHFIVSVVGPDGRTIMWDGNSYDSAVLAAEELADSYACKVHDMVGLPCEAPD